VDTLPVGLPEAVRRRVELVDVIWLRRNEYTAMFEVEATTDIFKALLRMADLITLLPNLIEPPAVRHLVLHPRRRSRLGTGSKRGPISWPECLGDSWSSGTSSQRTRLSSSPSAPSSPAR
jgi:hypothetical protein